MLLNHFTFLKIISDGRNSNSNTIFYSKYLNSLLNGNYNIYFYDAIFQRTIYVLYKVRRNQSKF